MTYNVLYYVVKYILIFISHFNFLRPSKFQNSIYYHPKNFIFYFFEKPDYTQSEVSKDKSSD